MPKKRILYIILITALLAVPFYYLRDEMDTEELKKNRYWIAKANNKKSYPVVFGGDSRVFRGISPDHFEVEFNGYETYNYAFWSNGMGRIYLEGIEKKVDSSSDQQVIVLGISPHSLTPNAAECAHFRYEMSRSKEQVLQNLYLSKVQEVFAPYGALELAEKALGKSQPSNYRITYHQNGWVESYWIQPDTGYSAQFYEEIFTENRVSEEVTEILLEFVERWTRMGIHVVGFRPPTSNTIRMLEHERGGFVEETFVDRFTRAGGIWIPVETESYQTFDGNHVEHLSAMRLSADLARLIREQIPEF
jgi:hypothetical protein